MKKNIPIILLFLYFTFLLIGYSFYYQIKNPIYFIIAIILALGISIGLNKLLKKININLQTKTNPKRNLLFFIICFFLILIPCLIVLYIFFPGGYDCDLLSDYLVGLNYFTMNVLHSNLFRLIIFRFISLFTNNIGYMVLWQIILFCLTYSYLITTLYKHKCNHIYLLIIYLNAVLNPYILSQLCYPSPDIFLIMELNIILAMIVKIKDNPKWLDKQRNLFGIILFSILLIEARRNGILITLFILAYVLYLKRHALIRPIIYIIISFLLINSFTLVPNYNKTKQIYDVYILPLNVIGNVLVNNQSALTKEDQTIFLGDIPYQDLIDNYQLGKAVYRYILNIFPPEIPDNIREKQIISLFIKCIKNDFYHSLEAIYAQFKWIIDPLARVENYMVVQGDRYALGNKMYKGKSTYMIADINDDGYINMNAPYKDFNQEYYIPELKLISKSNSNIFYQYASFITNRWYLRILFNNGFIIIVLIIFLIYAINTRSNTRIFIYMILAYNLLTMFFTPDEILRYYIINYTSFLPIIFIGIKQRSKSNEL